MHIDVDVSAFRVSLIYIPLVLFLRLRFSYASDYKRVSLSIGPLVGNLFCFFACVKMVGIDEI